MANETVDLACKYTAQKRDKAIARACNAFVVTVVLSVLSTLAFAVYVLASTPKSIDPVQTQINANERLIQQLKGN